MAARHAGRQRYAWLLMVGLAALVVTLATTQAQAPKAGADFRVKAYESHLAMTQQSPYKDQSWSFLGPTNVSGRIADVAPAGDDTGLVAVDLDVRDERDRTVIRGQVEVVWRRGDAPAAPPAERTEQDRTVVPL